MYNDRRDTVMDNNVGDLHEKAKLASFQLRFHAWMATQSVCMRWEGAESL